MDAIGRKRWAIPEGYIPSGGISEDRTLLSHETACILNAGDSDAQVTVTIFFANREPVEYRVTVGARRTLHLRFNDLQDPQPIPRDTDYASVLEADVPIVVQHTRLELAPSGNCAAFDHGFCRGLTSIKAVGRSMLRRHGGELSTREFRSHFWCCSGTM